MIVVDPSEAQAQVAKLGVHTCVGFPAAMFALALILRKWLYSLEASLVGAETGRLLGYVCVAASVAIVLIALRLKRRLIRPENLAARIGSYPKLFAKQLAAAYVPILAVCAAPAVLGLLFFFVVGDLDTYVLVSVICPAAYLAVKPRQAEVERLAEELFRKEEDDDIHL